jgi:uncharacterized damage-inducible protein DinB
LRHVRRLFEHLWWADERVLESIERAAAAPAETAADAGVAGELLAHVLGAELVWLDRTEGEAQSTAVWPEVDPAGCRALARHSRQRWATFLDALEERDLGREVVYANSAGDRFVSTVEEIALHVALHGAYHRGQIAMLLREAGAEPAPTDFIAFTRGAPAATRGDVPS